MPKRFATLCFFLFVWSMTAAGKETDPLCLPAGIKANDIVSAQLTDVGPMGPSFRKVRVKQELRRLKARCKRGKLVDSAGQQIRFYRLTIAPGCFGMKPPDYEQRLAKQAQEIAALKKKYHVIEMTCNPSGIPRP